MSEASYAVALARDQERRLLSKRIGELVRENSELRLEIEYLERHLALAEIRIEELEAANREEAIRGR